MLTNASKFTLFVELNESFNLLLKIANDPDSRYAEEATERTAIIMNEVEGVGVDLTRRVDPEL